MNDRYYLNFDRIHVATMPFHAWTDYPFRELGDTANTAPARPVIVSGHDDDKRVFVDVIGHYDHTGDVILQSDAVICRVWVESDGMQRDPIPGI
jgi:hypothetical protein